MPPRRTSGGRTCSRCGKTYCPNYPEQLDRIRTLKPDLIVVSGGRNNVGDDEATLHAGIHNFFRTLRAAAPQARIVATSAVWDSTSPPARLDFISSEVSAAVASVSGRYVDVGQPLAGHPTWIAPDKVHPNDLGHAAIAAAVARALHSA